MKRLLLVSFCLISFSLSSQNIKSPSEFFGYELGTEFTRHHEVVDYYTYLAQQAPERVQLTSYGKTNERRPLLLVYVSSPENISDLENIRKEHLKSAQGEANKAEKAIVWLSYNVHGNESVSTEASMQTIYELLTNKSAYLENTVVIIDPCINPDGRDRYSNWYNQYKNSPNQVDPNSKEHHEGWWNGRSNHYMFDLNRDWAWLTQVESQQRLKVYNQWLPHVHVDFHEQGVDNPYYFAPAAEPYHEVITDFQREFQVTLGKNHAKYFDANGWFYFTKEIFDLFYPSYGDTYPTYNGAIGMTYEQGGSGRAGLGVITKIGDTLTLKDRISHHFTTGMSTVEVSSKNAEKLNSEFEKFYQKKNFKYKSYALNGDGDKRKALEKLLRAHEIEFGYANTKGSVKGYNYSTGVSGNANITENTLVVSTNQTKGTLVKVLFEPKSKLSDSLTYDITAWSLPYAYGLDAVASMSNISFTPSSNSSNTISAGIIKEGTYAFLSDWSSMRDARFLADLLKEGIRVRKTNHPFKIEDKSFERGGLIITTADNKNTKNFIPKLKRISAKHAVSLEITPTGFVDSGKDFGSRYVKMIKKPKVAILSGKPTSTLRFGEIWHFFEQQLGYPLTVLDTDYYKSVDLKSYHILILPGGNYKEFLNESQLKKLKAWVSDGGKLIAMGGAIASMGGENGFGIKKKESKKDTTTSKPKLHKNRQRERIKNAITGAIFKATVDNTHPLAYGYGKDYFTLKLGNSSYDYLKSGNAAYLEDTVKPVSGFAGSDAQKKVQKSLIFGAESVGKGQVVYMVDNPLFRGFWENGKLFFANALFMLD
ncbi:M14 family metallopeptidase [Flagellimonas allohymeniacidonis]|uniref:Zinc carboxypeptidase n=1 Tax=Flagellimonas allohymeniacidonis TaxID=2517819 RepID=A0A4Q8QGA3_9FLAO|nr:M14 family metallopeptidase [Allomuricauda hymeniacidonis]TAI48248.1 zinc carboxypeptidase [Allomuricauda hymeniacidonis]